MSEIPDHPVPDGDLHLFHTLATIRITPRSTFEFRSPDTNHDQTAVDLWLRPDLDLLNFQELSAGQVWGWSQVTPHLPVTAGDQHLNNCTDEFLCRQQTAIQLTRPAIPAMLTCDAQVVRQDCLGYLMEQIHLG